VPLVVVPLAAIVMLVGSSNHSRAFTLTCSVFRKSPEVSTKPLALSNFAPLTSVVLASAAFS
jgi:hypothetical protein